VAEEADRCREFAAGLRYENAVEGALPEGGYQKTKGRKEVMGNPQ